MRIVFLLLCFFITKKSYCWGFFAHKKINQYAVFSLPPEMMVLYKTNLRFITEHAVDADKRKSFIKDEASRHFIDIDHYGKYPYTELPRKWNEVSSLFSQDTLRKYGIIPWHIERMLALLTISFKEKDLKGILKNSADIGHYIADAHVPLHTNSNHNGQLTGQEGIHGLWESRIPEVLADGSFNFVIGPASYISNPRQYIWDRVLESAKGADSVLTLEKLLSKQYLLQKYAYEKRNKKLIKQYSTSYTKAYSKILNGMVERRMREAIHTLSSFWLTAWVDAGQPDLHELAKKSLSKEERRDFDELNKNWKKMNFEEGYFCR